MENSNDPQFFIAKWNAVGRWSWEMEQDTCAICKGSLVEKCVQCQANDETEPCPLCFGECGHCFHKHCIDRWISTNPICPLDNKPWVESTKH